MGWRTDRWRLYRLALSEAGRAPILWLRRVAQMPRWRVPGPERLLFAPQDLRTSDPTVARDIYDGLFAFADGQAEARGRSPFDIPPPSAAWARALYGFGWLRHLRVADTALAREQGRALVADAIGPRRRDLERGIARETRVVARRVISFLCQSPLVLNGADRGFYARFLKAIGRGVAMLEGDAVGARDPLDRLAAAVALSYAALCCSGFETRLRRATRLLSAELDAQVLPDGGHVSRDPGVLIGLLLDLLPLRLLYASRGLEMPEALGRAVDRMMPMIRYLRGAGGELARFNGMGATPIDQVATLFSYDGVRGAPPSYAPSSGYLRLAAGSTILLADTGAAPPPDCAAAAHAGCLSFELSADGAPLVVNAGAPASAGPARQTVRCTAAHSTLEIGDSSSGVFLQDVRSVIARWLERRLGPALAVGPRHVEVERTVTEDGALVCTASHDGYRGRFGVTHARRWRLSDAGDRLDGEDTLTPGSGGRVRAAQPVRLRFHVHPVVAATRDETGGGVELSRPEAETWRFRCDAGRPVLEDGVFYGGSAGRRRTRQIVVSLPALGEAGASSTVRWSFERISAAPPARTEAPSPAESP